MFDYNFTPGKSYGPQGLEFIDTNIQAIDKQLEKGLMGKEVQYYNKGLLIKSTVYVYYDGNQDTLPTTIYLSKTYAWRKFLDIFSGTNNEADMQIKEIDLSTIFGGIK